MARPAKRQRTLIGEDHTADAAVLEAAAISDTEAAVRLCLNEAERALPLPCPFCLKSQVYSIVHDRTEVDRTLDDLAARGVFRVLKLPAKEDFAIVDCSRYRAAVEAAAATAPEEYRALFERFARFALDGCRGGACVVSWTELAKGLEMDVRDTEQAEVEAAVTRLVVAGLLVRDSVELQSMGTYRFAVPQAGPALAGVVRGREELAAVFRRAKFGQKLAKEVERVKLKSSPLGSRFHVRDMLGAGRLEAAETTRGTLYKLRR
eukprot:tig00020941_g16240.t1